jgi:SAM-dependent methyltransferase
LAAYLEYCLNTDPEMEFFLNDLRRSLILAPLAGISDDALASAALLARQCFLNEYVFLAEDDETACVADLKQHLEHALKKEPDAGAIRPATILYALYAPLNTLAGCDVLAAMPPDTLGPELDRLVELTLRGPLAERDILDRLKTLRPVSDETSRAVGAMYEENPYPRWLHAQAQQPTTVPAFLSGLFPHFTPPAFGAVPEILIAGSGTGQHVVLVARTHPGANITAIDLSKASLAYAVRMTRALDITNIRFLQADILDLGDLNQTFDMIQSVGVLHHMKDPRTGWRELAARLKPGGVFRVGLYSARGRMSIAACRQTIAAEGIGSTPADIARFRRRILTASPDGKDAALREVVTTRDFFTTSMCRDLLFHVQEHTTTPKGLAADLASVGLQFIGFEGFEDAGINAAYREVYADDPALVDLGNWETFEAEHGPLTDLYVFWCLKPPA